MKYLFSIACIFLFSLNAISQDIATNNQFSLNLIFPSAEYEVGLSDHSTIDATVGVGFAYHKSVYSGEAYGIYPGLELQYRYYYNFDKRLDKGKKISENSGNYITGMASITSGDPILGDLEFASDYGGFVGPAWGLQRVYNSGFKLNLNLGLGLGFNEVDTYFTPLFGIQLGWLIAQ